MKNTLSVIALGLLVAACIPHDPYEVEPDVTPWGTPRTHTSVSQSVVTQVPYTTQPSTMVVQQTPQVRYVTQPQQVVVQQQPQVRYVQTRPQQVVVQQAPQVQYVQQAQPIVIEQPAEKTSWWQKHKKKHTVKTVVPTCPCKDPNDPCTHCYQK